MSDTGPYTGRQREMVSMHLVCVFESRIQYKKNPASEWKEI